ncbi:nitroreductase family protein [Anaerophilus nitritogenes]|uniref:nitroreductase family protein n=1 Tax=Anaerophilus nitritogenes TaxID=2498136 RepID=UPI00101C50AF|nr:nitroreductase family protein [Anaerophilus nitritogenes]
MQFSKLVEDMRSIRDYKNEPVDRNLINQVIQIGEQGKKLKDEEAYILFLENGEEWCNKLSGKVGYFGNIIEAPHYIVMVSNEFEGFMENTGYIMENMRMKAWELGLGTCWLHIEDEQELKKILNIENRITGVIAIGYQYKGIFKKDKSKKSERFGVEELVYNKAWGEEISLEELQQRGFANVLYYAKFAPSWGNQQRWRFIIDQDKIVLVIESNKDEKSNIDAGIMMLYLEKAAYEENIQGNWEIEYTLKDNYNIPTPYKIVGFYSV